MQSIQRLAIKRSAIRRGASKDSTYHQTHNDVLLENEYLRVRNKYLEREQEKMKSEIDALRRQIHGRNIRLSVPTIQELQQKNRNLMKQNHRLMVEKERSTSSSMSMEEENKRQDHEIRTINNELGSLKSQIEKFQKTMEILRQRPTTQSGTTKRGNISDEEIKKEEVPEKQNKEEDDCCCSKSNGSNSGRNRNELRYENAENIRSQIRQLREEVQEAKHPPNHSESTTTPRSGRVARQRREFNVPNDLEQQAMRFINQHEQRLRDQFSTQHSRRVPHDFSAVEQLVSGVRNVINRECKPGLRDPEIAVRMDEQLQRIPVHQVGNDLLENKCAICQESFFINEKFKRLSCFHDYHSDCIDKALRFSNKCPLCKEMVNIDAFN